MLTAELMDQERIAGRFASKGVGSKNSSKPLSVKVRDDVYDLLAGLGDRPDRLRRYVYEGLERDGLLPADLRASAPESAESTPPEETPAPARRRGRPRKNGNP